MKNGYNGYAALALAASLASIMPPGRATDTAIRTEKFFASHRQEKARPANQLRRNAVAASRKATAVRAAA